MSLWSVTMVSCLPNKPPFLDVLLPWYWTIHEQAPHSCDCLVHHVSCAPVQVFIQDFSWEGKMSMCARIHMHPSVHPLGFVDFHEILALSLSLCCTLFVVNPNVPPPSLPPSLPLCMKPCAMFFCVSSFHGNISYWRLITEHQYHSSVSLVVVVAERLSVRLIIVQARRALVGP